MTIMSREQKEVVLEKLRQEWDADPHLQAQFPDPKFPCSGSKGRDAYAYSILASESSTLIAGNAAEHAQHEADVAHLRAVRGW